MYWGVIGPAATAALVLVTGFTWVAWASSRRFVSDVATPPAVAIHGQSAAQDAEPRAPDPESETLAALSPDGQVPSFQKPPPSPPLASDSEASVTQRPALPESEQGPGENPAAYEGHGTAVAFAGNPSEAARRAAQERKLLFVVHLSGNFEDPQFT